MILNDNTKKDIFMKLNDIIKSNIQDENWNNLDTQIKIKIIHHFCNFLNISNVDSASLMISLSFSIFKLR